MSRRDSKWGECPSPAARQGCPASVVMLSGWPLVVSGPLASVCTVHRRQSLLRTHGLVYRKGSDHPSCTQGHRASLTDTHPALASTLGWEGGSFIGSQGKIPPGQARFTPV